MLISAKRSLSSQKSIQRLLIAGHVHDEERNTLFFYTALIFTNKAVGQSHCPLQSRDLPQMLKQNRSAYALQSPAGRHVRRRKLRHALPTFAFALRLHISSCAAIRQCIARRNPLDSTRPVKEGGKARRKKKTKLKLR